MLLLVLRRRGKHSSPLGPFKVNLFQVNMQQFVVDSNIWSSGQKPFALLGSNT